LLQLARREQHKYLLYQKIYPVKQAITSEGGQNPLNVLLSAQFRGGEIRVHLRNLAGIELEFAQNAR
jgi:hypothetical protein